MSVELVTILLFASMLVLLFTGLPLAWVFGAVAVIFAYFLWSPASLGAISSTMIGIMNSFVLLSIPLFVFMADILERSGVADDLYEMMYNWFGPVNGGLAMGTVIICTIFAAMSGVSAAATITMGLIALPSMLKRGYHKEMAMGCIMAGGVLGILIPPSVPMILYAVLAAESVGGMFLGGVLPGLVFSSLFIVYIAVRCFLQPHLGPALPPEARASWNKKFVSLRAVILPIFLIIAVLGSIFAGIATPTEAAAVGAIGSIICAAIYRRLNWETIKDACYGTLRLTSLVVWIMFGAVCFASIYTAIGAPQLIQSTIATAGLNRWVVFTLMQISYFILGCLLDPMGILMITIPIYIPIIKALGFDTLWFGITVILQLNMAYLTPPFGVNLFYMKSIVPKDITLLDIYRSITPFVALQATGLVLVVIFPQLALLLPHLILGK